MYDTLQVVINGLENGRIESQLTTKSTIVLARVMAEAALGNSLRGARV